MFNYENTLFFRAVSEGSLLKFFSLEGNLLARFVLGAGTRSFTLPKELRGEFLIQLKSETKSEAIELVA